MTDSLIKLYNCKCDIYNSLFCYNFTSVSPVDWAIKSGPYAKSHDHEKLIYNFFISLTYCHLNHQVECFFIETYF